MSSLLSLLFSSPTTAPPRPRPHSRSHPLSLILLRPPAPPSPQHLLTHPPIHFFYSLRTFSTAPLAGPRGLFRSLITQLLSLPCDFDLLSVLPSRKTKEYIARQELDHLCALFRALVLQLLADTMLFCVLDGVSLFKRKEWRREICFEVHKLRELVEEEQCNAVFLLLLMSGGVCWFMRVSEIS